MVGGAAGRGQGRHGLGDGDFRASDGDGGHPLPTRHHPQPPAPGSALVDSSAALAPSRPEEEEWGVLQGQGSWCLAPCGELTKRTPFYEGRGRACPGTSPAVAAEEGRYTSRTSMAASERLGLQAV
jgi:hypothetical protein